jgi:hypothetical protein
MRVISGTSRGALAIFFAPHESNSKVTFDRHTIAANRVLGLIVERAFHVRKLPPGIEAPLESRGSISSSTVPGTSMSGERSTFAMIMDRIPRCTCSWYVIRLLDLAVHVFEECMLAAGV